MQRYDWFGVKNHGACCIMIGPEGRAGAKLRYKKPC